MLTASLLAVSLKSLAGSIGLLQDAPEDFLRAGVALSPDAIEQLIEQRNAARANKDWAESDRIRDELKAQEECNPDILIEQEGKDSNPHKTKYCDNNNKYLGDKSSGYGKQWNEKYQLDLIGRDYCRDRSIACEKEEFDFLISCR